MHCKIDFRVAQIAPLNNLYGNSVTKMVDGVANADFVDHKVAGEHGDVKLGFRGYRMKAWRFCLPVVNLKDVLQLVLLRLYITPLRICFS